MFYLYSLHDPAEGSPRYVGIAKDPQRRLRIHLLKCNGKTHKENWVRTLLAAGREPVMCIREQSTSYESIQQLERDYIRQYRERGFDLTNGTDGGDGTSGCEPWNKGRTKCDDSRVLVVRGFQGRRHTPEVLANMRGRIPWNKGQRNVVTDEARRRMSLAAQRRHVRESTGLGKEM